MANHEAREEPSEDAWNAADYDDQCAFVYEYGERVTELLDLDEGTRVLDLGCGTGHLSRELVDRGARVVGVDRSAEMVARARDRYGDVEGLRFVQGDARDLVAAVGTDSTHTFDAVFSNAALHWIPGPAHDAVLDGVRRLLKPGGVFVAELGGRGNVESIVEAVRRELDGRGYDAEQPWYFPSIGEYTPRLEAHGLEVRDAQLFDRPTTLDGDAEGLRDWLAMFGDGLFPALSDEAYDAVVDGVEARLEADQYRAGSWVVDYRRLRFRAVRAEATPE
ncbi:class I SAM-dependent methyltransferase [Salinigranum halophilum]|uniref:class I SAM-dependent methyltransferase n=1 Tax=Salinigranum halophilum TaxID=2565931 RepID=UPI00115F5710|nr:class I SAM-dependent methyltransferase [Salinigranum halophilum]